VPRKKLEEAISDVFSAHSKNNILTPEGAMLADIFQKYYNSNIPVDYWYRDMNDFSGPKTLKTHYDNITADLKKAFKDGSKLMFSSPHGRGKSMATTCILKRAVEQGFSAQYVNLTDIIEIVLRAPNETKTTAREILLNVDFLVIDEFDTRFMGSENVADLFGRIIEPIIRTRIQNRMPLFMCTNSIKVEGSFSGPLQASMESLMNVIKLVPIIGGEDARKKVGKGEL
jgi:DNA replication protein DnaC